MTWQLQVLFPRRIGQHKPTHLQGFEAGGGDGPSEGVLDRLGADALGRTLASGMSMGWAAASATAG